MVKNEHAVKFNCGVDRAVAKTNETLGIGIDKGAILAATGTKLAVKAATKGIGLVTKIVGDIGIIAADTVISASGSVVEKISQKAGAIKAGRALLEAQTSIGPSTSASQQTRED